VSAAGHTSANDWHVATVDQTDTREIEVDVACG
jgi:hypothetical protein